MNTSKVLSHNNCTSNWPYAWKRAFTKEQDSLLGIKSVIPSSSENRFSMSLTICNIIIALETWIPDQYKKFLPTIRVLISPKPQTLPMLTDGFSLGAYSVGVCFCCLHSSKVPCISESIVNQYEPPMQWAVNYKTPFRLPLYYHFFFFFYQNR